MANENYEMNLESKIFNLHKNMLRKQIDFFGILRMFGQNFWQFVRFRSKNEECQKNFKDKKAFFCQNDQ